MSIEHVIFLMFENRSFDSLLGWMSHPKHGNNPEIEGLKGPVNAAGELTTAGYANAAIGKTYRPFFADKDFFNLDCPHGRAEITSQLAFTPGTSTHMMNGFAEALYAFHPSLAGPYAKQPDCMRMLTRDAAPVTAWLAENYKVCDHWFTAIPAGTHPNRVMALAGETQIEDNGVFLPDHDLVFDWAARNSLDWRVYSDGLSFVSTMRKVKTLLTDREHYRDLDNFAYDYQKADTFPAVTFLEPAYLDDPFATHPNDNHPPLRMDAGEALLLKLYLAMVANRERFEKTVFVVYYDEHGGMYDHVAPLAVPTPPRGDATWEAFTTTGPRVPAIVISPLVDPGVYKDNLDHTSLLRFLAETFTPNYGYSDAVNERHSSGVLSSLGGAIDRTDPRDPPIPPAFGPFDVQVFPAGREAVTIGQQAFLEARKDAHDNHADDLGAAQPWAFFASPDGPTPPSTGFAMTKPASKPKAKPASKPKAKPKKPTPTAKKPAPKTKKPKTKPKPKKKPR